jgi:hypothetical protein
MLSAPKNTGVFMLTATITPGSQKRRHGFLLLSLLVLSGTLLAGPSGRISGGGASFSTPYRSAPVTPGKSYSTPAKNTKSPASSTRSKRLGGGESIGLQRESSAYRAGANTKFKPDSKEMSTAKTAAPAKFPVAALVTGAAIGYMVGKSNKEPPQISNTGSTAYYSGGATNAEEGERNLTGKQTLLAPLSTVPDKLGSDPDMKSLPAPTTQSSTSETAFLPLILLLMAFLIPLIFLWQRRSPKCSAG